MRVLRFFITLLLAFQAVAQDGQNYRSYFKVNREFPDLFLPEAYRHSAHVPQSVVNASRARLELATQNILRHMTVPISLGDNKEVKMVEYFNYLPKVISTIDPSANLVPSGGVVRSVIGYIYKEMYEGTRRHPSATPEETLHRLATSKESVPAYKVRGVGSDFDVLVESKAGKFDQIKEEVERITNSAEAKYEAREIRGDFKRTLFTIGDVKDYDKQTRRSTSQGGSDIDYLAFDTEKGKFIEPANVSGIVDNLVKGKFRYLAPSSTGNAEDIGKQTVRGMRPLLELPFLSLEDETQFKKELQTLYDEVEKGNLPSSDAMKQFDKMVRNARQSGANNRFYRGEPGSIENLIQKINIAINEKTQKRTIPEFGDRLSLDGRTSAKKELNGLPKELLISPEEFIAAHTKGGTLYHGTPNLDSGMAIMRGGLFISDEKMGTAAAYGRGVYTSGDYNTSFGYAGADGVVFELKFKNDKRLNILDWEKAKDSPFIKEIETRAKSEGRDLHEVLAREYGIDVIVHHHILIQNLSAVEIPNDIKSLVNSMGTVVDNGNATPYNRIKAHNQYLNLYEYSHALGEIGVKPPYSAKEFVTKLAGAPSKEKLEIIRSFNADEQSQRVLGVALNEDPSLAKRLLDVPHEEMSQVIESFVDTQVGSETLDRILKADPKLRNTYRSQLLQQGPESASVFSKFPWDSSNPTDIKALKDLAYLPTAKRTAALGLLTSNEQNLSVFQKFIDVETATNFLIANKNYKMNVLKSFSQLSGGRKILENIFATHPQLRDEYRDWTVREISRNPRVLGLFPWDLTKPDELAIFTKFADQAPERKSIYADKLKNISEKIEKQNPRLRYRASQQVDAENSKSLRYGDGYINWDTYPSSAIKNPNLRGQLEEAQYQLHLREGYDVALRRSFEKDPDGFIKQMRNTKGLMGPVVDKVEKAGVVLNKWNGDSIEEFDAKVKKVIDKTLKGKRSKITKSDYEVIDYLINNGDTSIVQTLLTGRTEVVKHTLEKLKDVSSNTTRRISEILKDRSEESREHIRNEERHGRKPQLNPEDILAIQRKAKKVLIRELESDNPFRAKYLSKTTQTPEEIKAFPWDLNHQSDVETLGELTSDVKGKQNRYLEMGKQILKQEGLGGTFYPNNEWGVEHIKPEKISDGKLQQEFFKARDQYNRSKEAVGVLEILKYRSPRKFVKYFPSEKSEFSGGTDEIVSPAKKFDILEKWNKNGFNSLTRFEKDSLVKFRELDITGKSGPDYRDFLRNGEKSRTWVIERILESRPNDDLTLLAKYVSEDYETKKIAKQLPKYKEFKAKLRALILKEPEKILDLNYNWDYHDSEDITLLKTLNDTISAEPWNKISQLESKVFQKFPTLRRGFYSGRINDIPDPKLRSDMRAAKAEAEIREQLGYRIKDLSEENPQAFVKDFGSAKIQQVNLNIDKSGQISFSGRGYKTDLFTKEANDLLAKINKSNSSELTQNDFDLIRVLMRQGGEDFINLALNGRDKVKDFVLENLKEPGNFSDIVNILGDKAREGEFEAIHKNAKEIIVHELNYDSKFRASFLQKIEQKANWEAAEEFPWDITKAGDVATIKKLTAAHENYESKRKVLDKVAKRKGYQIEPDEKYPEIPDLHLRKLYKQYASQSALGKALPEMLKKKGIDPAQIQSELPLADRKMIVERIKEKLSNGGVCEVP